MGLDTRTVNAAQEGVQRLISIDETLDALLFYIKHLVKSQKESAIELKTIREQLKELTTNEND